MATTYEAIATVTVGSGGASSISFSSIPATYTDIVVKWSTRSNRSAVTDPMRLGLNSSTTSFTTRYLSGNGSSTVSGTSGRYIGEATGNTATSSTFSNGEIYIPNYAGANNKSVSSDNVSENNATEAVQTIVANLWSNTNAITSVELTLDTGSFMQYSTATLYGIKNS